MVAAAVVVPAAAPPVAAVPVPVSPVVAVALVAAAAEGAIHYWLFYLCAVQALSAGFICTAAQATNFGLLLVAAADVRASYKQLLSFASRRQMLRAMAAMPAAAAASRC